MIDCGAFASCSFTSLALPEGGSGKAFIFSFRLQTTLLYMWCSDGVKMLFASKYGYYIGVLFFSFTQNIGYCRLDNYKVLLDYF